MSGSSVPRSVTLEELQAVVDSLDELDGWDLSPVKTTWEPEPWVYQKVVRKYLTSTSRVLDIGTGGGEVFLKLADAFGEGVGIDQDPTMIRAALRNRDRALSDRVQFRVMAADRLLFPDHDFDVVLSRHLDVFPTATARVLRQGGYFICQDVGPRMNQPMYDAFGWGSNGQHWGIPSLEERAEEFKSAGCRVVAAGEFEVNTWFSDLESLVFYMRVAPLPEVLDPMSHLEQFNRYIKDAAENQGYLTNEHKRLLIIQRVE